MKKSSPLAGVCRSVATKFFMMIEDNNNLMCQTYFKDEQRIVKDVSFLINPLTAPSNRPKLNADAASRQIGEHAGNL